MNQINTLPLEGFAYKITDRPCSHFKDGRHKGDCSVCVREVLVEANAATLAKLDATHQALRKFVEAYGHIEGHASNCVCAPCAAWDEAKCLLEHPDCPEKKNG